MCLYSTLWNAATSMTSTDQPVFCSPRRRYKHTVMYNAWLESIDDGKTASDRVCAADCREPNDFSASPSASSIVGYSRPRSQPAPRCEPTTLPSLVILYACGDDKERMKRSLVYSSNNRYFAQFANALSADMSCSFSYVWHVTRWKCLLYWLRM